MTARSDRWVLAGIAALATFYLIQLASPLRIDNDAVAYLLVAMDLADGATPRGTLPLGYPWTVAILDRIGIASAPTMLLVNFLSMAAGLAAVWYIGRDRSLNVRAWTTVFTLLSYPIIRETMLPHPEAVYFGISLIAIAVMTAIGEQRSSRNLYLILGAIGLIVIAVTIRVAAVTLVPPLLWCVYRIVKPSQATGVKRAAIITAVSILVILALAAAIVFSESGTLSRYVSDAARQVAHPPLSLILKRIEATFRAFAELSVNLPISRVPQLKPLVPFLGIPVAFLLVARFRSMQWRAPVSVYVGTYILVLIVWPFFASRLWIPIIPLLALHLLTAASETLNRTGKGAFSRFLLRSWAFGFLLIGVLGMVYTTRISLSGEKFRYRFGVNGGMASPGHEGSEHNAHAKLVIERYDPDNRAWRWLTSPGTRP